MDAFSRALQYIPGGRPALARLLDIKPQAIHQWTKKGVPPNRCIAIEEATGGKVTRYDLRPDVFGAANDSEGR